MQQKIFLRLIIIAALAGFTAGTVRAEKLTSRMSQGNNVGMQFNLGWGTPFNWDQSRGRIPTQFPRGSGNSITNWVMTICAAVARDLDGDGTPEDTMRTADGSRAMSQYWASSYAYDYLAPLAAAGENMNTESTRQEVSYIWSSLDEANLADWPIEARKGQTANGDPVLYGAETIAFHCGDVFLDYYGPPPAIYQMWSCYFLNFGESNNMVYCHLWNQNMSEYLKWNPSGAYADVGRANPNGVTWDGLLLIHSNREPRYGGNANGWMYHPAREITGVYGQTPTISSFTPPEAPIIGFKMLNPPVHNGETGNLVSYHTYASGEFGVSGINNPFVHLEDYGAMYRTAFGLYPEYYGGQINPWTGKTMVNYPGVLTPEDERYDQWLWGGSDLTAYIGLYGELHDVAPRDTFSLDCVFMFTYPGVKPFTRPQFDLAERDNPMVQDAFQPLLDYADVAEIVQASGYKLPETPSAPALTIIPGDREVTITWADINIQTPDTYYYFLEEYGLNPSGYYREYDFEGYRVYRSYVGPNDSHSEILADFSITAGNIQFYYIDRLEDDITLQRMKNGQKVWYALVPYDKNYDAITGEEFSLPLPASGKVWNRPGQELYTVIPRSNASEFRAAGLEGEITFSPAYGSPEMSESVQISGNGDGTFAEAPKYLAPVLRNFEFEAVNNERLNSAKTVSILTSGTNKVYGESATNIAQTYGSRAFSILDGSITGMESGEFTVRRRNNEGIASMKLNGPVDASGVNYALSCEFDYMSDGDFRALQNLYVNDGGYTGAEVINAGGGSIGTWPDGMPGGAQHVWIYTRLTGRYPGGFSPGVSDQVRTGRFTLTFKDAGGGNLTLEVQDVTRGYTVPFVEYPDDGYGWGFVDLMSNFSGWAGSPGHRRDGVLMEEAVSNYQGYVPNKADRTEKMFDKIPADTPQDFLIFANGVMLGLRGVTSMPAAGTVFTLDCAWGTWNDDKTVFTQTPEAPWPGDKWDISIKPSSMDPDDIDLSRIKVVPNPYVATSFLDLSPSGRRIEFVNLPAECTIRIYTLSGNLVNVLNHIGVNRQGWGNYTDWDRLTNSDPNVYTGYDNHSGTEPWNMRNRFGVTVASGLYLYHVTDSRGKTHTGSFYIVN